MRFVSVLAAMAALLAANPAFAQKRDKPEVMPLFGVNADHSKTESTVVTADPENTWVLDLSTGGRVLIRLRPDIAPKMVERVKTLTRDHFYDGLTFHRVIDEPYNIAQGGDPKGDGTGESTLPDLAAEFSDLPHVRGMVSAARMGAPENATPEQKKAAEDSANSQFFIMLEPHLGFDHDYTVFGRVFSGMQWVDKIERGEPPADPTRIVHAYIQADNPPPYSNAPASAARAPQLISVPEGKPGN